MSGAAAIIPDIYEALPTETSFRVIELLPGTEDDPISYMLHLADLNEPPKYEALSYVWGDSESTEPTMCNGKQVNIRPNLHYALRQLRRESQSRILWADAICINQSCTPERNQQVSKMILIYRSAQRVLVWLGPDENGQAAEAFGAILDLDQKKLSAKPGPPLSTEIEHEQSRQWRSLKWLLSLRWFSRIWVVQEVASNPEVLVHCGALEIRWELLATAVNHICSFDHEEIFHAYGFLQSEIWSARIMIILQQSFQHTDNNGKLGFLHFLRRFCATDARDKVFAVLGMKAFREINQTSAGLVETSWIRVDYYKSAADVYRMVAEKAIFSEPRNLAPLSYVLPGSEKPSPFSSWAPRWDQLDSAHILLRYIQARSPATNCSKGITTAISRSGEANILEVCGIQFDTVVKSTEIEHELWFAPQKPRLKSSPFLEFWRANNRQFTYPTSEDIATVFSMVFTGGKNDTAMVTLEGHRTKFEKWLARLQAAYVDPEGSVDHKHDPSAHQVEEEGAQWAKPAQDSSWNRVFLETKSGYMGLGPKSSQEGDVLCGEQVPFLLRSAGEDTFRLVGECYVYGIMNGEAVRASKEEDLRTFRIE